MPELDRQDWKPTAKARPPALCETTKVRALQQVCGDSCAGVKRGYDDGGQESMKRMRYDDEAALGPDGKRLHTDTSAAIPGSETVYRLLVPAKKVSAAQPCCFRAQRLVAALTACCATAEEQHRHIVASPSGGMSQHHSAKQA